MIIRCWLALCSVIISLTSCFHKTTNEESAYIACTTGLIADVVRNLVEENEVKTVSIIESSLDPHTYKATRSDLEKLVNATIIFHNGLHLEGNMSEILQKLPSSKKVFAVSDGVDDSLLISIDKNGEVFDPHIWFDTRIWQQVTEYTADIIIESFPELKNSIIEREKVFLDSLQWLTEEISKNLDQIPDSQRFVITSHDAFNYMGNQFDIEVIGLQGISTVAEFGLRDIIDMVNFVIDNNIKSVFVETSVSSKSIESVIEGCMKKGVHVKKGDHLYSDGLGKIGTYESTYIGAYLKNVHTIVSYLK